MNAAISKDAHAAADSVGIIREWASVYTLTATQCACCGLDLRDAVSVARGIGPECSRKHYNLDDFQITTEMTAEALGILHASALETPVKLAAKRLSGKPRDLCNVLVWWASAHLDNVDVVLQCAEVVSALGLTSLGDRLRERNTNVVITTTDNGDYILRCRSKLTVRQNMNRLVHKGDAQSVGREGRFKYGWRFTAKFKALVLTILGEDFGGQWATVPGKPGKPSRVIRIPLASWKDVRAAFETVYPRPTLRHTVVPRPEIVQVKPDAIEVHTPSRNWDFVDALKRLPYQDRRWDPRLRCWRVAPKHLTRVRELVATHFQGAR